LAIERRQVTVLNARCMGARTAIKRAREVGVTRAAIVEAHRLGVPVWPVVMALRAALAGKATEAEVEQFLTALKRPAP
jgi:hypothetical protein